MWICPLPDGHIQAVGTDAAGRRQYRYHADWVSQRGAEKFERVSSAVGNVEGIMAWLEKTGPAGG